jgi:hypothetical protein
MGSYVQAWKTKDITVHPKLIVLDRMATTSESKPSDKENEIATAKTDCRVDIHECCRDSHQSLWKKRIAPGLLSAIYAGGRTEGTHFQRHGAFLAALAKHDGLQQLVAIRSTPINPAQPSQN